VRSKIRDGLHCFPAPWSVLRVRSETIHVRMLAVLRGCTGGHVIPCRGASNPGVRSARPKCLFRPWIAVEVFAPLKLSENGMERPCSRRACSRDNSGKEHAHDQQVKLVIAADTIGADPGKKHVPPRMLGRTRRGLAARESSARQGRGSAEERTAVLDRLRNALCRPRITRSWPRCKTGPGDLRQAVPANTQE
jgi:hypothetical protein